jgi:hypothetical protein
LAATSCASPPPPSLPLPPSCAYALYVLGPGAAPEVIDPTGRAVQTLIVVVPGEQSIRGVGTTSGIKSFFSKQPFDISVMEWFANTLQEMDHICRGRDPPRGKDAGCGYVIRAEEGANVAQFAVDLGQALLDLRPFSSQLCGGSFESSHPLGEGRSILTVLALAIPGEDHSDPPVDRSIDPIIAHVEMLDNTFHRSVENLVKNCGHKERGLSQPPLAYRPIRPLWPAVWQR